jgi:hypothetical protein
MRLFRNAFEELSKAIFSRPPRRNAQREARARLLRLSATIREGNFTSLSAEELQLVFTVLDEEFFGGSLAKATVGRLAFRLSERMTSSGGMLRRKRGRRKWESDTFEIVVSSHLLFLNFREGEQREVNGVPCRDRLDGLMRIMEHEMLHLAETLLRGKSSCRGKWFREAALHLFGHVETTHRLTTTRGLAHQKSGLRIGETVSFKYKGQPFSGRLNRITKRATVLVETPDGTLYSDGRKYRKFYVPLGSLAPST